MSSLTSRRAVTSRPPASAAPAAPFRLGKLVVIIALLVIVGLAAGLIPRLRQRHASADESRELAIPTVDVITPAPGKAGETLTLSGELKPLIDAPIYARANGYVRRWLVDIGAHVEAGQLLAELDTPETDREFAASRAELRQSEAALSLATATNQRWAQMLGARTVSAQEAQEKSGDLAVKQAASEASAANVERLTQLQGFARLTAPFAGVVTARNLDVGQLVVANSGKELFHVAEISKLRLFVRVPQSYAQVVKDGQTAQVAVPELPGQVFEARVVRTSGAIDAASRTLLTELEIDNSKGSLLAGSYARVKLSEAQTIAPLTVPSNTLLFRAQGPQIGVVDENQKVTLRDVTIGRDFGASIEILKGVEAQDKVVLNPPDSLVSGVQVRVKPPAPPAPAPAGHAPGK